MSRRGMTLMELTVGLAVTGMMTAAGYAAFGTIVDQRDRARTATATVARAAATRQLLDGWLAGSRVPSQQRRTTLQAQAVSSSTLGNSEAELQVITSAPTPLELSETVVRLYIDDNEATLEKGLVAELTSNVTAADGTLPMTRTVQIDSSVTRLLVEYLDRRTSRWVPGSELATIQPIAARLLMSNDAISRSDSLPALLRYPVMFLIGDPRETRTGLTSTQGGAR